MALVRLLKGKGDEEEEEEGREKGKTNLKRGETWYLILRLLVISCGI